MILVLTLLIGLPGFIAFGDVKTKVHGYKKSFEWKLKPLSYCNFTHNIIFHDWVKLVLYMLSFKVIKIL